MYGWSMTACGLVTAPKLRPPAGRPPIPPASTVRVISSRTCSSWATEAMPSGMPMPRFTIALGLSASVPRRAMALRGPAGSTGSRSSAGPDLARVGRVVGLGEGLPVVVGPGQHDTVDQDAGDAHLARVEHVHGGDPLH